MSFTEKIKRAFILPEDETTQPKAAADSSTSQAGQSPQPIIKTESLITNTPRSTVSNSEINENIKRMLWQTLIDKNLPGPDYLELKVAADNLAQKKNLPEKECYEMALLTMQSASPELTVQRVISSIDTYIDFINQEEHDGKAELEMKRKEVIGTREQQIQDIDKETDDLNLQLASLQQRLNDLSAKRQSISTEIANETKTIDTEAVQFTNTVAQVISVLQNAKNVISTINL